MLDNPDGSVSTERTITIEAGGRFYNIPTIVNGVQVTNDAAVMLWKAGDNKAVGEFDSLEKAVQAAKERSNMLGGAVQRQRSGLLGR